MKLNELTLKELIKLKSDIEEEIEMLQKSGFREVKCIYSHQKFSVIAAIK